VKKITRKTTTKLQETMGH